MRKSILFIFLGALLMTAGVAAAQYWKFPPPPPPSQYGNILINRLSEKNGQLPVTFSHWSHRRKDTCRVCHFELGFEMQVNATEITEAQCRNGKFCGACHDGKDLFGHTKEHCKKCHNGNIAFGKEKFKDLDPFPKAPHGNKVDWAAALKKGLIKPRQSILDKNYKPMAFKKKLTLEAAWTMIPPAHFSHEDHKLWLDCSNCHPDIFNVKKKSTKHFEMNYNLKGKFCGACHLKVAFPLNDCKRCHPKMKR
jgi:c(7)-type cytochrome triheme protein